MSVSDKYVKNRIAALTRNGSIKALRDEAAFIRTEVRKHFDYAEHTALSVNYAWVRTQLARAEAFDKEADRLDRERPAGAAGLHS